MDLIQLNSAVECKMTKRRGIVYGMATYVYGETQFQVLFEGEKEQVWQGVSSLNLISK